MIVQFVSGALPYQKVCTPEFIEVFVTSNNLRWVMPIVVFRIPVASFARSVARGAAPRDSCSPAPLPVLERARDRASVSLQLTALLGVVLAPLNRVAAGGRPRAPGHRRRMHRREFRLFWTWKSRRRTGRPILPAHVRALIQEVVTAPRSPWQKDYASYCTSFV